MGAWATCPGSSHRERTGPFRRRRAGRCSVCGFRCRGRTRPQCAARRARARLASTGADGSRHLSAVAGVAPDHARRFSRRSRAPFGRISGHPPSMRHRRARPDRATRRRRGHRCCHVSRDAMSVALGPMNGRAVQPSRLKRGGRRVGQPGWGETAQRDCDATVSHPPVSGVNPNHVDDWRDDCASLGFVVDNKFALSPRPMGAAQNPGDWRDSTRETDAEKHV